MRKMAHDTNRVCVYTPAGGKKAEYGVIISDAHMSDKLAVFLKGINVAEGAIEGNAVNAYTVILQVIVGLGQWSAGILLGRGLNIDEAKAELNGVTLESLVVATRVARAIKVSAKKGDLDPADFPLLLHSDEILTDKKPVDIPWEAFTFEK